jgi:tRNA dimethylallyltransferase
LKFLKMPFLDLPAPLIVILGPTAVGKTQVALELAERLGGEIVSADSRLFYRGMDIGTAKPTWAERERVPHHLIDVADPDEVWSLPVFQQAARQAIQDIHSRHRLPFLVGGTGQYIRAVTEGWLPPVQQPDPQLRTALEKWASEIGPFELHCRLAVVDPQAASTIQPQNVRRTVRALEVIFCTGEKFSTQRQRQASPYSILQVGLTRPRPELYARIDARIDGMLAAGFQDEVRRLLEHGYSPDLPPLSAIGYREMIAYFQGKMTLEAAIVEMKRLTRQFVRRQANWFKAADPSIHWFTVGPTSVDEVEAFIRA